MRKILSLLLCLSISAIVTAQIKISELPTATGHGTGGWLPIAIGGITKKIKADSLGNGGSGSGTVTSATAAAPLYTTNTTSINPVFHADTSQHAQSLATAYQLKKSKDSVQANINALVIVSSVTPLAPLLNTGTSSNPILKADTGRANAQLATGYDLNKVRDSLQANIAATGAGTVTGVTATAPLHSSGSSTIPNITVDTGRANAYLATGYDLNKVRDSVQANISGLSSTYYPLTGGNLNTGSFLGLPKLNTQPSTPGAGYVSVYMDSLSRLSYVNSAGYRRTYSMRYAGDQLWYFPYKSGGGILPDSSDVWAQINANTAALLARMDSLRNNAGVLEARKNGVFIPQFTLPVGTVTSFSTGNLSPLFTASVATATSTPALSFSLSNAAAYTNFGNNTGSSAAPAFFTNNFADSMRRVGVNVSRRVNGVWLNQYTDSVGSGGGGTATDVNIPLTTSLSAGTIRQNSISFLHTYGTENLFLGRNAGNFTTTASGTNIGIGDSVLYNLTTGVGNTAIGYNAMRTVSAANDNVGIGKLTLKATTGDNNVAIGSSALAANTSGSGNVAIGTFALSQNLGGTTNMAIGVSALQANTSGVNNTAIGGSVLTSNVSGGNNVAIGTGALTANTNSYNTAIGYNAMANNNSGQQNTAVGQQALNDNTSGSYNTAIGLQSQKSVTSSNNSTLGFQSLYNTSSGASNVGIGYYAGKYNTTAGSQIFLNSLDRTNYSGDQTGSPFYAQQSTTVASQIVTLNGSVGINQTAPAASAVLDIPSTTKGVLIPRMTTTQKNAISSPAEGLEVYDLTLHQKSYYNGTTWINY